MAAVTQTNTLVLKNLTIQFPGSSMDGKCLDVLLENGVPVRTAPAGTLNEAGIEMKGCILIPGLFDLRASFRDPGYEEDETLLSGSMAAARGGFTGVALATDTNPCPDQKTVIEYLIKKTAEMPVHIYPMGCVSSERQGKELAELYDMARSGAVAFSDYKKTIENPHLLMRGLIYTKGFGKTIIQIPDTPALSNNGKMHEGITSTLNGLKGIPSLAEELMVKRDLDIASYYDCSIHLGGISSAGSVEAIRQAKARGVKITADVHSLNLALTDEALNEFDTRCKVKPPLRTEEDRQALIHGIMDGTLDAICSDHSPRNPERKVLEFDLADFGASQIETAFLQTLEALGNKSLDVVIEKMALAPRRILQIPMPVFEEGKITEATLYNPTRTFTYRLSDKKSLSVNSPNLNQTFQGTVQGIICKGKVELFPTE